MSILSRCIVVAACLVSLLVRSEPAAAVDRNWNAGTGLWTTAGNWSPSGVPQPADHALINFFDSSAGSGGVARLTTNAVNAVTALSIYNSGALSISAQGINAGSLLVGTDVIVGRSSTHGTISITSNPLVIATGGMTIVQALRLGVLSGVGNVSQNAGTMHVGNEVILGDTRDVFSIFNPAGIYTLSGSGRLRTPLLKVGAHANASGTFNLSGGVLDTNDIDIGARGVGVFNQTGGLLTTSDFRMGFGIVSPTPTSSVFNLSGGSFTSGFTQLTRNSTFNYFGGDVWPGHLHLYQNARINIPAAGNRVFTTYTLHMHDGDSVIDIADNRLEIAFSDFDHLNTLRTEIGRAYNGGSWTGRGITSSTAAAAAGTQDPLAVGYAPIVGVGLRVQTTLYGDADLDGDVDGIDIGRWAQHFTGELGGAGTKYWYQGDWDYDGDVDGLDAGLWAQHFTGELGSAGLSPEAISILNDLGVTVVPEPSAAITLAFAAALLVGGGTRRRF